MPKNKTAPPRTLYFIGIKGTMMSGLAIMAKDVGYLVSGSDVSETFPTDALLTRHQIEVFTGFDGPRVKQLKPDLVVVSAAYGLQNPEVKAAKSARLNVVSQSEMLARLMAPFEGIGVAGVHGKTTTTAMVALILVEAGFAPSYAIGASQIPGLQGNAKIGEGKYFVVEADEYRRSESSAEPKFLDLPLKHVIITSIELDHPDLYETAEAVYQAFYRLCVRLPRDGTIIANLDWPLIRRLASRVTDRQFETYGLDSGADYQLVDLQESRETTSFRLKTSQQTLGPFSISLPGSYNALNATAAIIMTLRFGVTLPAITRALSHFQGPERRFQYLGKLNGAPVFDDFAHHPTAVTNLLAAARKRFPDRRIVLVFQPHTYSRTGKFLQEFAASLQTADVLVLLNIYASAREKTGYVSIKDLINAVRRLKPDIEYRSSLDEVATYLSSSVKENDLVLLVGAGDVYKIFSKLQNATAP